MNICLKQLSKIHLDTYLDDITKRYSEALYATGAFDFLNSAKEKAKQDIGLFFGNENNDSSQFVFEIFNSNEMFIGYLWCSLKNEQGIFGGYICDLFIKDPFRRQGYGMQTMQAAENFFKQQKVNSIKLHVFKDNFAAERIYKKLNYEVVGQTKHNQTVLGHFCERLI